MKSSRNLLLVAFFLGLVALEVAHGVFRLEAVRESQRRDLFERIERAYRELAGELQGILPHGREHASYLAATPAVRDLLAAPWDPSRRRELEEQLLPYLLSFRGIDRMRVLDGEGLELFRCERIGRAVGVLPRPLLAREPDSAIVELVERVASAEVAVSPLGVDDDRLEVPEGERQVLHCATRVSASSSQSGILVLTVYARPFLRAVSDFEPVAGVSAALVDGRGRYVGNAGRPPPTEDRSPPSTLFGENARAASRLLSGAERVEDAEGTYLGMRIHENPRWILVGRIPGEAIQAATRHLRGEYVWIIGSTVGLTAILALAAAFFVRMSARELRLRDLARQKELERRLRISERLGSLGLLTAGVAHEINNPLEGIGNYLALLERDSIPPEKRKRYLELVRHGFARIRDIVRDLASFTRSPANTGTTEMGRVIQRALSMVRYSDRFGDVEVELRGLDRSVRVAGDAGRLEQVFLNLLLNAAKAMDGNGRITVTARNAPRGPARTGAGDAAGDFVEVLVEDDGPGIPEDDLTRLFDPFFTRAAEGESSMGLGLFIAYGIVDAHGGTLQAENRPQGGARFVVRLPAEEGDASSIGPDTAVTGQPAPRKETAPPP